MKQRSVNEPIPPDFGYAKHPNLRDWIERKYPQLDADETMEAFIDAAPNFKKDEAKDWQARFRTCIRIAMANKWSGICVPKKGHEIDYRWQEALTYAKAIGCPEQRRATDSVESFNARVKMWESRPSKTAQMFDFSALKKMV